MIKVGICDDNLNLQEKYQKMINEILNENKIENEVVLFNDGKYVVDYMSDNENALDILFLDILMKDVNGMETANRLRKRYSKVLIIFLTSSEEYVFDTMEMKPFAYIMKDQLTMDSLSKTTLLAIKNIKKRKADVYLLETKDSICTLSFEDISFIKVSLDSCSIHCFNGTTLKENNHNIIELLKKRDFFQIHPHYIVGLHYIEKIEESQIALCDNNHTILPIDKTFTKNLKLAFSEYMMQEI